MNNDNKVCQKDISLTSLRELNQKKAFELVDFASMKQTMVGCAESCTGGLLAAYITSISGSSACMQGGIVSYACSVKHNVLGVEQKVLDSVGAVSSECAGQMAEGAAAVLEADVAVSITGIAGPSGAVPGKPVGTVWFGIAIGDRVQTHIQHFDGTRSQVREQSVSFALDLLLEAVHNCD